MNKAELVEAVASKTGLTQKDTSAVVDATLDVIMDTLSTGDDVALTGFGSFSVSRRAAREGRNPRTGETIQIAATNVPKFRAGKHLKDAVRD